MEWKTKIVQLLYERRFPVERKFAFKRQPSISFVSYVFAGLASSISGRKYPEELSSCYKTTHKKKAQENTKVL